MIETRFFNDTNTITMTYYNSKTDTYRIDVELFDIDTSFTLIDGCKYDVEIVWNAIDNSDNLLSILKSYINYN